MSEVRFLPWAKINRKLSIGPVNVVPWNDVRSCVPEAERTYLDTCFKKHLNDVGQPIEDITLLFIGNDPIPKLTEEECRIIRRAFDALVFTAIATKLRTIVSTGNTSMGVPNSERFQLVRQRVNPSEDFIADAMGGTFHVQQLDDVLYHEPLDAGSSDYSHDEKLLFALGVLLTRRGKARNKERIFRALEWFRFAHSGNEQISNLSHIVMLATAFEILLEIGPMNAKRKAITTKLDTLTSAGNLRQKTITFDRKGKQKQKVNAIAVWGNEFYFLRNKIVHGNKVKPSQLEYSVPNLPGLTQLHVAALVVWEVICWELFNDRLLGKEDKRYAKNVCDQSRNPLTSELVRHVFAKRFNEYHQKMGWTKIRH